MNNINRNSGGPSRDDSGIPPADASPLKIATRDVEIETEEKEIVEAIDG